jgi:predicted S18 family serine protease
MLAAIIGIAEHLLALIQLYMQQRIASQQAGDAQVDAEVQSEQNALKNLGDSVSGTMDALQQLRDRQAAAAKVPGSS